MSRTSALSSLLWVNRMAASVTYRVETIKIWNEHQRSRFILSNQTQTVMPKSTTRYVTEAAILFTQSNEDRALVRDIYKRWKTFVRSRKVWQQITTERYTLDANITSNTYRHWDRLILGRAARRIQLLDQALEAWRTARWQEDDTDRPVSPQPYYVVFTKEDFHDRITQTTTTNS
jgi:hypothetical protein